MLGIVEHLKNQVMILDYQINYLFQTCKGGFDKPTQKLIELLLRKKCETQHRLDLINKYKNAE